MTVDGTPIHLGPITQVLLIGGGQILLEVANVASELGLKVSVITSKRHTSAGPGESELSLLQDIGAKCVVANTLDEGVKALGQSFLHGSFNLCLGSPWILSADEITRLFGGRVFNCHGTLLPRNRGAAGFSWQILMGNRYGATNIYLLDSGVDTGPILAEDRFVFPAWCREPHEFESFYQSRLVSFLAAELADLAAGRWVRSPKSQAEGLSTYWPRLRTEKHGFIDWQTSCSEIARFVCAFDHPYPGARTHWRGREVVLRRVQENYSDGVFHPFQAGLVYRKGPTWLDIAVRDGNLIVETVEDIGGDSIIDTISVGERFWSKAEFLDASRERLKLGPEGWLANT